MKYKVEELKLVQWPDKILTEETTPFDFENPSIDPKELSEFMVATMQHLSGVGLAAPQLGLPESVFVMGGQYSAETVFNPEIVAISREVTNDLEGCLSFPGMFSRVIRPNRIEVKYQNVKGEEQHCDVEGYDARVFIHEYAHLKGRVFLQDLSKLKLQRAIKKSSDYGYKYTMADFSTLNK